MSCGNSNTEISAEISEALETLGPKFQNAQNFDLNLVRGALKDAVNFYALFSPNIQVPSAENLHKSRSYKFSRNPRRVIRFLQKRERMVEGCLCNGFFKTYALIPCLFSIRMVKHEVHSILSFDNH
jgi:hypothetical protein